MIYPYCKEKLLLIIGIFSNKQIKALRDVTLAKLYMCLNSIFSLSNNFFPLILSNKTSILERKKLVNSLSLFYTPFVFFWACKSRIKCFNILFYFAPGNLYLMTAGLALEAAVTPDAEHFPFISATRVLLLKFQNIIFVNYHNSSCN